MRQALLAAPGVVLDGSVVLDDSTDDLEKADAAGEGVGHGFEHDDAAGLAVGDGAGGDWRFGRGGAAGGLVIGGYGLEGGRGDRDGRALDGGGGVDLDEIEEMVGGHVGEAAGEQDGED